MRYLLCMVLVALLATPTMATWYEPFNYQDGALNTVGSPTWQGNAIAGQIDVAGQKVVVTAGAGLTWALADNIGQMYESDNTITFAIKLQMVSGDVPDNQVIGDIFVKPTSGQEAGWRITATQARGRQGDFTTGGVEGNKTNWQNLVGNSAAGTWDLFEVVNNLNTLRTYYYVTPAGGTRTQIGDAGNGGLAGSTGINQVWFRHVDQPTGADQINTDDFLVTPEPTTLVLLGLGFTLLRRRGVA